MPIASTWFAFDQNHDADYNMVLDFASQLPQNLLQFIDPSTSNLSFYLSSQNLTGVSYNDVVTAHTEATTRLLPVINSLRSEPTNSQRMSHLKANLDNAGLSGSTFKLKLNVLNALWERAVNAIKSLVSPMIDYFSTTTKKGFRKFLDYLNKILGSLAEAIPGVESLKELKELLESFFGLDD